MLNDAAEMALRRHLELLELPPRVSARWQLRELLFRYVDALKRDGHPPEHIIVRLKQITKEVGVCPASEASHPELPVDESEQLVLDMVGWCIDRYYASPARAAHDDTRGQVGA